MLEPTAEALKGISETLSLNSRQTVEVGEILSEMQMQVWVMSAQFVTAMERGDAQQ